MRTERRPEALCDVQGLQGRRGFHVSEGHCAKFNKAEGDGDKKCRRIQKAFVFEMSVGHGGNCNRFKLRLTVALGRFVNHGAALLENGLEMALKLLFIHGHGDAFDVADKNIMDIVFVHDGLRLLPTGGNV